MNKYNARNLDRFFKLVTELIFFIAVMVTVETEINNNIVLDHQFKLTQNEIKHWHKKHIALCWPTLGCWKWASLIKMFGWHVLAASGTCSTRWKMCHSCLLNCWPRGIVQNKYWVDLMEYKDWMGFHQAHHSSSHLIDFQGRMWFVVIFLFNTFSNSIRKQWHRINKAWGDIWDYKTNM